MQLEELRVAATRWLAQVPRSRRQQKQNEDEALCSDNKPVRRGLIRPADGGTPPPHTKRLPRNERPGWDGSQKKRDQVVAGIGHELRAAQRLASEARRYTACKTS